MYFHNRRSWLFCWTELGAKHVGIIQSLIVTCRLHGIDPYTYLIDVRAGLGFSDRSLSGGTAIFSANRRSSTDETTQTQPLTGLQGPSGFGRHQGREDAGAASGAL